MIVHIKHTLTNYLTISDHEFLVRSIRNWEAALKRNDMPMFEHWAMHAIRFAYKLTEGGPARY